MHSFKHETASTFYQIAEWFNLPFHWVASGLAARLFTVLTPNLFGNLANPTFEVLVRISIAYLLPFLIIPVIFASLLSLVFNSIGDKILGSTP